MHRTNFLQVWILAKTSRSRRASLGQPCGLGWFGGGGEMSLQDQSQGFPYIRMHLNFQQAGITFLLRNYFLQLYLFFLGSIFHLRQLVYVTVTCVRSVVTVLQNRPQRPFPSSSGSLRGPKSLGSPAPLRSGLGLGGMPACPPLVLA